jgi:hypothetical protein
MPQNHVPSPSSDASPVPFHMHTHQVDIKHDEPIQKRLQYSHPTRRRGIGRQCVSLSVVNVYLVDHLVLAL